jgi:hypothetical protein
MKKIQINFYPSICYTDGSKKNYESFSGRINFRFRGGVVFRNPAAMNNQWWRIRIRNSTGLQDALLSFPILSQARYLPLCKRKDTMWTALRA